MKLSPRLIAYKDKCAFQRTEGKFKVIYEVLEGNFFDGQSLPKLETRWAPPSLIKRQFQE
jgi:hypothetical protein